MVYDRIENAKTYYGLGKGIETALKYFESYDAATHEPVKVVIDGEKIFVNRMCYTTAPNDAALFEAHKDYIDVMFVAEGEEKFFFKPVEELENITKEYDASIDACLATIDGDAMANRFKANHFAIFFPQDGHCGNQLWDEPSAVKKLIAKVHVSTL